MKKEVVHLIAKQADLCGFLDHVKYRNYCIKEKIKISIESKQQKLEEIAEQLAKEYSLELETILTIYYRK